MKFAEIQPARVTGQNLEPGKPLTAASLLCGRTCMQIVHNGQVYQLSLTRNDKLILTK